MNTLQELEIMKVKLEELERERMKVEGKQAQILEQLKARGLNSYEEAVEEHSRLVNEKIEAEAAAEKMLAEIKERYAMFL